MFLPWKCRPCYWVQPPGAHPRAPALLPADAGCRRHGARAVTSLAVTHGDPSTAKRRAAPTPPQHAPGAEAGGFRSTNTFNDVQICIFSITSFFRLS